MVRNLDKAIINSYRADYHLDNQPNQMFPEYFSGSTNMNVSETIRTGALSTQQRNRTFNYFGGKVTYNIANYLTRSAFSWGNGVLTSTGGYFGVRRDGVLATIERLTADYRVVDWLFPTVEAWQRAKYRVEALFKNRW